MFSGSNLEAQGSYQFMYILELEIAFNPKNCFKP